MKKIVTILLCCLSLNFLAMPPKKEVDTSKHLKTINALKEEVKHLKNKNDHKKQAATKQILEKDLKIKQLRENNQKLQEENQRLKISMLPATKLYPEKGSLDIQGASEQVLFNKEHIINPQFDIKDIGGGHKSGSMQKLHDLGIVEIMNIKNFKKKNGCTTVTARTNNGTEITKTEFPDSWDEKNIIQKLTSPKNQVIKEEIDKDNNNIREIKTVDNVVARMIITQDKYGFQNAISAYPVDK